MYEKGKGTTKSQYTVIDARAPVAAEAAVTSLMLFILKRTTLHSKLSRVLKFHACTNIGEIDVMTTHIPGRMIINVKCPGTVGR